MAIQIHLNLIMQLDTCDIILNLSKECSSRSNNTDGYFQSTILVIDLFHKDLLCDFSAGCCSSSRECVPAHKITMLGYPSHSASLQFFLSVSIWLGYSYLSRDGWRCSPYWCSFHLEITIKLNLVSAISRLQPCGFSRFSANNNISIFCLALCEHWLYLELARLLPFLCLSPFYWLLSMIVHLHTFLF